MFVCPVLQADQIADSKKTCVTEMLEHSALQQLFMYVGMNTASKSRLSSTLQVQGNSRHLCTCANSYICSSPEEVLGSHQKSRTNTNGRNWYQRKIYDRTQETYCQDSQVNTDSPLWGTSNTLKVFCFVYKVVTLFLTGRDKIARKI